MTGASTNARRYAGVRSSIVLFTVLALPLLAQPACGSEDDKRAAPNARYRGGEGGEGGELSGGATGSPGESGSGGLASNGGSDGNGNGGSAAAPGEGGSAGAGTGAGGEAGGGPDCPTGTADCDDDPTTCEADVTTLDQCGACGVMCEQNNGDVICGDSGCEVTSCMPEYGDCNDDGTDGCEASLTTADNCGSCARDCGAQACTNKLCDPVQLGGDLSAYRWAPTADALYRITGSTPSYGLASNYVLTRTPLDGGAEVVMHSDAKSPGGLVVDDTNVYWAVNGTPAAVLKKAHSAAAAAQPQPVFETPSIPVQLRIQGNYLYWTNLAGAIYRRALSAPISDDGDEIVTAAEVAGTGTFNLHQDFVTTPSAMYWVVLPTAGNLAFIRTAPLAGGSATDVAGAITGSFLKLALVGEDLYWIRATGSALDGAYHYEPGGQVESLVLQAGLNAVHAAGAYLYLLGGTNTLYRAPIAGGNSVQLGMSGGLTYAMDFAGNDATNVYVQTTFTHGAGFFFNGKLLGYPL